MGIATFRRPAALERLLRSALKVRDSQGLIVLDDESDPGSKQVVASLNSEGGARIRHVGRREKLAMEGLLSPVLRDQGVDPDLARFALVGDPAWSDVPLMANRNALFLLGAGGHVVGLDDDVVCELAPPGDLDGLPGESFRFHSLGDPTSPRTFPSRSDLLASHPLEAEDPVPLLLEHLGWRPEWSEESGWADRTAPGLRAAPDLSHASALMRRRLGSGGLRVALTSMPVWGHSGSRSPHFRLLLKEPERVSLVHDEGRYEAARTSPWEMRPPGIPTISDSGFLQETVVAYDLTLPLPPIFPHVPRNRDGIQGALIHMSRPGDVIHFRSEGMRHERPESRAFSADDVWRRAVHWGMGEVILVLLTQVEFAADAEPGFRTQRLAQVLREAGEEPELLFLDRLVPLREGYLRGHLRRLEQVYDEYGGHPRWWAEDVERSFDQIENALSELPPPPPDGGPGPWSRVQPLLVRCGSLLEAWPTVLSTAADLQEELAAIPEIPR